MRFSAISYTTSNSAAPAPATPKQLAQLAAEITAEEWLLVTHADGCDLFMQTEQPPDPAEIWKSLHAAGVVAQKTWEQAKPCHESKAVTLFFMMATAADSRPHSTGYMERIRDAYTLAASEGHTGAALQWLFQKAIWLHEKARMDSGLFKYAISEEQAVLELARKIFGNLHGLRTEIMGWDAQQADLIKSLHIASGRRMRCFAATKAQRFVAEHDAVAETLVLEPTAVLHPETDILLLLEDAGAAIPGPAFIKSRTGTRQNAPMLLFDFRSAQKTSKQLKSVYNLYAYNRAELQRLITHNRQRRLAAAGEVLGWIEQEVQAFAAWLKSDQRHQFAGMIGTSPQMQRIFELISRTARSGITVLIQGESGTGKELVARAIHQLSNREKQPFIAVNCGAIPENLLESELFGHVRGAFTGAVEQKQGLFAEAEGGTIFLDEVAEMPLQLQVKLLRFLQEGEIKKVGSNNTEKLDVRVVAATNRDLQQEVESGHFRSDLFYRLNVLQLEMPPLRERAQDIPLLVRHFVHKFNSLLRKQVGEVSTEALEALQEYNWPGNIRELENAVERALALAIGNTLSLYDLPDNIRKQRGEATALQNGQINLSLKEMERQHILKTLEICDWDYELAAEKLEIGRTTLWRKLKAYGVADGRSRRPS